MGSGATRPNNADDKMMAAIERGEQPEFQDRKPTGNKDKTFIKEKAARVKKEQDKIDRLRALRLAAEEEAKAKK